MRVYRALRELSDRFFTLRGERANMNCERVNEQIPECLAGRLEKAEREKVIDHLETCAGCRNELAELGVVWRGMERWPFLSSLSP